jgi:hypothetical protein
MTRRRTIPVTDPYAAEGAAKAAASRKAERAPHTLTEGDVKLLPGRKVLELGNAGKLQHLGLGLPVKPAAAPKTAAGRPAVPSLSDAQLSKMSGGEIRQAIAAGRVPGVGPRREGRRH